MPSARRGRRKLAMTDTYIAQGQIRWGPKDSKGKEDVKVFYDGDAVTGPDKDEMQQLIDAGAVLKKSELEKRSAPEGPSEMESDLRKEVEAKNNEIAGLKTRIAELEGKGTGQGAAQPGGADGTSRSGTQAGSTAKK
jgi:hypothetical protein